MTVSSPHHCQVRRGPQRGGAPAEEERASSPELTKNDELNMSVMKTVTNRAKTVAKYKTKTKTGVGSKE